MVHLEWARVRGSVTHVRELARFAGAELKGQAPADFFANLIENGGGW